MQRAQGCEQRGLGGECLGMNLEQHRERGLHELEVTPALELRAKEGEHQPQLGATVVRRERAQLEVECRGAQRVQVLEDLGKARRAVLMHGTLRGAEQGGELALRREFCSRLRVEQARARLLGARRRRRHRAPALLVLLVWPILVVAAAAAEVERLQLGLGGRRGSRLGDEGALHTGQRRQEEGRRQRRLDGLGRPVPLTDDVEVGQCLGVCGGQPGQRKESIVQLVVAARQRRHIGRGGGGSRGCVGGGVHLHLVVVVVVVAGVIGLALLAIVPCAPSSGHG
eukprot:scaffold40600_cov62-Phaeocystis_antarctica.AAC.6